MAQKITVKCEAGFAKYDKDGRFSFRFEQGEEGAITFKTVQAATRFIDTAKRGIYANHLKLAAENYIIIKTD